MKSKLRGLECSLEIIVADSKAHIMTEKDWLQGGIMIIINGNISTLVQRENIKLII